MRIELRWDGELVILSVISLVLNAGTAKYPRIPMPKDHDLSLKLANDSGFPLQIAIERQVMMSQQSHGWMVYRSEHSWVHPQEDESGFIDLVLQDRNRFSHLVLECKRVREATWLFMNTSGSVQARRHAKPWVTHFAGGGFSHYGWCDVPIDPPSPEAMFCAIRGQSANDKATLLERIGGDLVYATEAFAAEERDFRSNDLPTVRLYFNVIVTTADLKIAEFNPDEVSLLDGTIPKGDTKSVPLVRLRKQLAMRAKNLTPMDYLSNTDTESARQHSVLVLRSDYLLTFLKEFDIPNSSLRQFQ